MPTTTAKSRSEPKRADALRNIEAILEAATTCLARDPEASISSIAEAAAVGRVTVYGHFESRSALIARVAARALQQTHAALADVDLDGDPNAALVNCGAHDVYVKVHNGAAEAIARAHGETRSSALLSTKEP